VPLTLCEHDENSSRSGPASTSTVAETASDWQGLPSASARATARLEARVALKEVLSNVGQDWEVDYAKPNCAHRKRAWCAPPNPSFIG